MTDQPTTQEPQSFCMCICECVREATTDDGFCQWCADPDWRKAPWHDKR
jgi:hypothetical protein